MSKKKLDHRTKPALERPRASGGQAELHAALIDALVDRLRARRVLLVLQRGPERVLAGARLPRGESAAALLDAVTPWLEEAQRLRTTHLRHGPAGAAPVDQRSCLLVPLMAHQLVLGCVYADTEGRFGRFDAADGDLAAALASQAAVALAELGALGAQLEQRASALALIRRIQQGMAAKLEFQGIVDLVGDELQQVFAADRVAIVLVDSVRNEMSFPYVVDHGERHHPPPAPAGGISGHAIRTRQTLVFDTEDEISAFRRAHSFPTAAMASGEIEGNSFVCVPLIAGAEPIGAVCIGMRAANAFDADAVRLIETLAAGMSAALENARLFDEAQRLLKETEQRKAELAVINSIQQAVAAALDFQAIVDVVGDKLREVFATGDMSIRWWDEAANRVHWLYVFEHGTRLTIAPEAPRAAPNRTRPASQRKRAPVRRDATQRTRVVGAVRCWPRPLVDAGSAHRDGPHRRPREGLAGGRRQRHLPARCRRQDLPRAGGRGRAGQPDQGHDRGARARHHRPLDRERQPRTHQRYRRRCACGADRRHRATPGRAPDGRAAQVRRAGAGGDGGVAQRRPAVRAARAAVPRRPVAAGGHCAAQRALVQRGAAGACGRRNRQRSQERLPRHHEPRDPHADERGDRHERAAAGHAAVRRATRFRAHHPRLGRCAADDHQRHPRLPEDRGRTHGHRGAPVRPARMRRVGARPDRCARGRQAARPGLCFRRRRAGGCRGRRDPVAPGAAQPAVQRGQIHRGRRGGGDGARAAGEARVHRARHRHRPERAGQVASVPEFLAGRFQHHAQIRRYGPGSGDQQEARRTDGRPDGGRQRRARTRQHLPLHHPCEAGATAGGNQARVHRRAAGLEGQAHPGGGRQRHQPPHPGTAGGQVGPGGAGVRGAGAGAAHAGRSGL